jgi:hypothetical protein
MAGTDDALDRVLRLVSEGRLTADEAGPILDALSARASGLSRARAMRDAFTEASRTQAPPEPPDAPPGPASAGSDRTPRFARIQVMEGGRRAVDLRVPVGLGRFALSRVPGLSSDQIDEMQSAMSSGTHGPILDIQDADGDGVRIVLE